MSTNSIEVSVRGGEIILKQNYVEACENRINMIQLDYNLTIDEAEQLIELLREGIDILEDLGGL